MERKTLEQCRKTSYFQSLDDWKEELKSNRYGLRQYAVRAINLLETEIERYWPGELELRTYSPL